MGARADFKGIRAVVLTVSDSRSRGNIFDESGEALICLLKDRGAFVIKKEIVSDDKALIAGSLRRFCGRLKAQLILTTGGTGLGPRDVTPEATNAVVSKQIPGLIELMRQKSFKKTGRAALSRAVAGVRGLTLIINLPGSPKGARESFEAIASLLPHALAMIKGEGHKRQL